MWVSFCSEAVQRMRLYLLESLPAVARALTSGVVDRKSVEYVELRLDISP